MALRELGDGTIVEVPAEEEEAREAEWAATLEKQARASKIEEIKAECLVRIANNLPLVDTFVELDSLRTLGPAFQLTAAGIAAKDTYAYARTAIDTAKTAPLATVEAYDPTTDPGWP